MDSELMSRIIRTDIGDHFAIFCTIKANGKYHSNDVTSFKGDINKDTISDFKYLLKNVTWIDVLSNKNAIEAYDSFLPKFTDLYNIAFVNSLWESIQVPLSKLKRFWTDLLLNFTMAMT